MLTLWRSLDAGSLTLPFAVLALIGLMILPVPGWALDIFFTVNLILSILILMLAVSVERPLDFSSFPTVLLFATLLRLALNIASTRLVLLSGHEGTNVAGAYIESFGHVVVGGDFIVGIFVFVILIIINLIVIARGAGRISEVSARFTLDALPGKQMAIDADLGAGLLTADEARARRAEVASEADFYGSMDGASKFVKGDAIAGILILLVNVIGGIVLGTLRHDLTLSEAAERYILLAVGDGLVAQMPALMLSVASAVMVTRVSDLANLGRQVGRQLSLPRAWMPVAAIMATLALLPGMPLLFPLAGALIAGGVAAMGMRRERVAATTTEPPSAPADPREPDWSEITATASIAVELGVGLIGLVDVARGAPLPAKVTALRRQLSAELGFAVPLVRLCDNLRLAVHGYALVVQGETLGTGEVDINSRLAIEGDHLLGRIDGRIARDPTYNLPAVWIDPSDSDTAEAYGYTVVDASTVVVTHLRRVIVENADQLLGHDDVQAMLNALQSLHPHLVAALVPKSVSLAVLTRTLQLCLRDGIMLREFRRIAEAIAVNAPAGAGAEQLYEGIRPAVVPLQLAGLATPGGAVQVALIDSELEELLLRGIRSPGEMLLVEPALLARFTEAMRAAFHCDNHGGTAVALPQAMVVQPQLRRSIARIARSTGIAAPVLAFGELPDRQAIDVVSIIGRQDAVVA